MRVVIILAATAALSLPALAQQPRPPARAPAAPPAAQAPAPPPGMFPCRTEGEVCHVGVATSASQVAILYSNAPQGQAAEGKTVSVQGVDLAQNVGKVVMLTGELGAGSINGAQLVEAAGPLLSFALKLQLGGDGQGAAPAKEPAPRGGPPPRR